MCVSLSHNRQRRQPVMTWVSSPKITNFYSALSHVNHRLLYSGRLVQANHKHMILTVRQRQREGGRGIEREIEQQILWNWYCGKKKYGDTYIIKKSSFNKSFYFSSQKSKLVTLLHWREAKYLSSDRKLARLCKQIILQTIIRDRENNGTSLHQGQHEYKRHIGLWRSFVSWKINCCQRVLSVKCGLHLLIIRQLNKYA